ncbi:hypothetical protein [Xanthomonas oryzae]|nr:hypothetical protein [Xanthomonas oryzae]QBG85695.1 hypothetical protein EYR27_20295 [Xanthomonas oryzae]
MYDPASCGVSGGPPSRLPDYDTFQLDAYVFSFSATYTAYGDVFLGAGVERQYPNPSSVGVSISSGWMINPCKDRQPTRKQLNAFLNGYSGGASGYFGVGGGYSVNPSGQGFNIGVGFGGFTVNPGAINNYQGNIFGDSQP